MKKFFLKWGLRNAWKDAIGKHNSSRKCDIWKEPLSFTIIVSEAIFLFVFEHCSVGEDVQELDMLIGVLRDINE